MDQSWVGRGADNGTGIELMSVGLIGQAVRLFALANIDDDLDRKCASQDGLAAPARPVTKRWPARSRRHKAFTRDAS